jgi:ribosomal protein L14
MKGKLNRCINCEDSFDGKILLREDDIVIVDLDDNVITILQENKNSEGTSLYGPEEYGIYDKIKYCDTHYWRE